MPPLLRSPATLLFVLACVLPAAAVGGDSSQEGAGEAAPAAPAIASLPQYLADLTRDTAESLVAQVSAIAAALGATGEGTTGAVDWERLGQTALELLIVAAATLLLFAVLRRLARISIRWLGEWSQSSHDRALVLRRAAAIAISLLVSGVVIALAWIAGHALALYATGAGGAMSASQSLFLNAFLGVEVLKVAARLAVGGDHAAVRLLPLPDSDATYWDARLGRLVTFAGYGLLFVVPLARAHLAPVAGATLSLLVLVLALAYTVAIVRHNRAKVRAKLEALAESSRFQANRLLLQGLARAWHGLAIAYFVGLAGAIQTRPAEFVPFMGLATVQSVLALAVGLGLYNAISQLVGRRPPLPAAIERAMPQIGERVAFFVGPVVHGLRALVALAVAVALLDAWGLFDLAGWLGSDASEALFASAASVAFIAVAAAALWIVFATWIDRRLGIEGAPGAASARERTLLSLFRNAAAILIVVMTAMIALSEIGIEIGPLLAGAGVIGLAVGFGAQSLVQDIITGVFIQLENAINRDDVVTVAGITGVVERLSVRSVGLRDLAGTFHIVPFSQVGTVSNYMRGYAYHLGEYDIAYREDPDEALECLKAAFADLRDDPELGPSIQGELEIDGVTALAESSVKVRARIKTEPGMQWAIGRAYNHRVKRHLDAAGIEIPFPHMTLYFGQDRDGSAPPANLRWVDDGGDPG